jgi:hypothetical protein
MAELQSGEVAFQLASPKHGRENLMLSRRSFSKSILTTPLILRAQQSVNGNFIEHLGRCIYGGVFDENSSLSDSGGFHRDVLDASRSLGVTLLRWPGGNFSSNYHWRDGIGPRDQRPPRLEMAWGTVESNRFGTHEGGGSRVNFGSSGLPMTIDRFFYAAAGAALFVANAAAQAPLEIKVHTGHGVNGDDVNSTMISGPMT